MAGAKIDLSRLGRHIVVYKNEQHPEYYLWLEVDDRNYFLGVLETGMTRGDVKAMALRWLKEHPEHLR